MKKRQLKRKGQYEMSVCKFQPQMMYVKQHLKCTMDLFIFFVVKVADLDKFE